MHKGLKLTGPATTGPTVIARGRGGTECQIFVLYAHLYLYFRRVVVFVFSWPNTLLGVFLGPWTGAGIQPIGSL